MAHSEPKDVKERPEVTKYKAGISKEAEKVVFEVFPSKIEQLTDALEGEMFSVSDLTTVHWTFDFPAPPPVPPPSLPPPAVTNGPTSLPEEEQPVTKKRKLDDTGAESGDIYSVTVGPKVPPKCSGVVPCNPKLIAIIDYLKPEIMTLVDQCNKVKMWIQLMIPKIEDGNNFGVSIQEDVLAEVTKAEADAGSYLEQMSRYFGARARMLSKVAKYPYLEDYRRGVDEYDEKVFLSFKLMMRELRNIYVVVYDMIVKNYEKIIQPRTSNSSSLY